MRFVVRELVGYRINLPVRSGGNSSRQPGVSFTVHDTENLWRVVARFDSEDRDASGWRTLTRKGALEEAIAECDRLNSV